MTRTQRRHAARGAHQAKQPTAQATAPPTTSPQLSENDWTLLADTLNGLLQVEFPSPFTNLQLRCPKDAWLVVELANIPSNATDFRQQLLRVLHALARLLIHAEAVRPWRSLYETFWKRILTSDMVRDGCELDTLNTEGFVRFVHAKGTHVTLQWRGRSLDANQVIDPIQKWLRTVVDEPSAAFVPAHVALRFENCQLTTKGLKQIHQLLRIPRDAGEKRFLCEPSTLHELSLSSNILHTHMLHELGEVLEDPSTRRIDGLNLDSTMPGEPYQTRAYTVAFRRVITAVVSAKAPQVVHDGGVFLSLEDATIFHATHVDALADVLVHASRPLRGLSVACWRLQNEDALQRLGQLFVMHLPTATEEFDLDASCLCGPESFQHINAGRWMWDARAELLKDACLAAQAAGKALTCRPLHYAMAQHGGDVGVPDGDEEATGGDEEDNDGDEEEPDDYEEITDEDANITLSDTRCYQVRHVMDCGCCVVVVSPATADQEEIRCTLEHDSIANVYVEGVGIFREGSLGLIVDGCKRRRVDHKRCTPMAQFASGLVARVTRLSVRHKQWDWESFSTYLDWQSWSLELVELNAEGSHDCHDFIRYIRDNNAVSATALQVVNITDCGFASSKRNLVRNASPEARWLLDTAHLTLRDMVAFPNLRSLRFAHNKVGEIELEALLDALSASQTLELLDLRSTGVGLTDDTSTGELVTQIETLLQLEHVSTEARDAFLLVLQRLATMKTTSLPSVLATSVLAYAGANGRRREVLWK